MKKLNISLLILLLCFVTFGVMLDTVRASENKDNAILKEQNEESHKEALQQEANKQELIANLKKQGLTMDDIAQEGVFYFTENNEMVVKLLKDPKNKVRQDKIKKGYQLISDNAKSNLIIENVSYSQKELENITENWFNENSDINFTEDIIIKYNYINNRIDIKTNELDKKSQKILSQRYGNKIHLDVDPSFVDKTTYTKQRTDDWNKLGAGIGIKAGDWSCSTAGVAKKDTRYFIITAGHCVGTGNVFQYNSLVGTSHLDSRNSGYDFGLVQINKGSLTRYASNGLYIYDNNNPSDYDGRLRHLDKPVNGETLCKSGKTTGYTCGKVTSTTANVAGEVNYEITKTNGWMAGSGDSGSASFRSSNGYLIGITSRVSNDHIANGRTYGHIGYFTPYATLADRYGLSLYTNDTPTRILN